MHDSVIRIIVFTGIILYLVTKIEGSKRRKSNVVTRSSKTSTTGLEELKKKRDEVVDIIYKQEAEKSVLEQNMSTLQEKLEGLNKRLNKDRAICEQYDSTIKETEEGFKKILESSQALLQLAQHETTKLELRTDSMMDTEVSNRPRTPIYRINY